MLATVLGPVAAGLGWQPDTDLALMAGAALGGLALAWAPLPPALLAAAAALLCCAVGLGPRPDALAGSALAGALRRRVWRVWRVWRWACAWPAPGSPPALCWWQRWGWLLRGSRPEVAPARAAPRPGGAQEAGGADQRHMVGALVAVQADRHARGRQPRRPAPMTATLAYNVVQLTHRCP